MLKQETSKEQVRRNAVYGFRFSDLYDHSFYQLFAIGHQCITDHAYHWDGEARTDGPLYLFQYTVAGCGEIELNGQVHRVSEGEAFQVEIPGRHRYYLPPDSGLWEIYFILYRPKGIRELHEEAVRRLGSTFAVPPNSKVIRHVRELLHAAEHQQISDAYIASSMVYSFVMELLRLSQRTELQEELWPEPIRETAAYVKEHYQHINGVDELAELSGMSKYHFIRVFSKVTGCTPMHYMTKARMEKAVELLRFSDATIEEIAEQVGYANGSYFSKVFRKWVGSPPTEFRREPSSVQRLTFD